MLLNEENYVQENWTQSDHWMCYVYGNKFHNPDSLESRFQNPWCQQMLNMETSDVWCDNNKISTTTSLKRMVKGTCEFRVVQHIPQESYLRPTSLCKPHVCNLVGTITLQLSLAWEIVHIHPINSHANLISTLKSTWLWTRKNNPYTFI